MIDEEKQVSLWKRSLQYLWPNTGSLVADLTLLPIMLLITLAFIIRAIFELAVMGVFAIAMKVVPSLRRVEQERLEKDRYVSSPEYMEEIRQRMERGEYVGLSDRFPMDRKARRHYLDREQYWLLREDEFPWWELWLLRRKGIQIELPKESYPYVGYGEDGKSPVPVTHADKRRAFRRMDYWLLKEEDLTPREQRKLRKEGDKVGLPRQEYPWGR